MPTLRYHEALRFDPSSADVHEDIAREFAAVTGESAEAGALLLDWVLDTDRRIKLQRGRRVAVALEDAPGSESTRQLMLWLSHRVRLPGKQRASRVEASLEFVRRHEPEGELRSLVDFGGGGGNDAIYYGKCGFDVVCADLPSALDEEIQRRFDLHGVPCLLADVRHLAPPRRFDVLHSMDVLEHIYDVEDALAKMLDLVRPGGYLVIEEDFFNVLYNDDHIDKNRFYDQKVPRYLRPFARLLRSEKRAAVLQKMPDLDVPIDEVRRRLYGLTRRRARAGLLVHFVLMFLTPIEALLWRTARLLLGPASKLAARLKGVPRAQARSALSNLLYKRQNYLVMDRFSDAVACYRVAGDRLRKLRDS